METHTSFPQLGDGNTKQEQYYSKNLGGVMQIFLDSDVDLWGHV